MINCFVFQGAEYEVLDDSQEHWWKVKDEHGYVLYSVKEETNDQRFGGISVKACNSTLI